MGNGFVDWLKKKAQQDIVAPIQRDVAAPIAHAATAVAAPVVHAAEQAGQDVNNDVIKPVQRDILKPISQPKDTLDNIGHDLGNAADSLWQGANRDVLHPIYRAPQNFVNDVSDPVDKFVEKSAIGRGAADVGLGALRAGGGLVQAAGGLNDLVQKGVDKLPHPVKDALNVIDPIEVVAHHIAGHPEINQKLTNFNKSVDEAAKPYNPALYHGAQIATNLLPALLTGGTSEAATAGAEGTDAAVSGVEGAEGADAAATAANTATKAPTISERLATAVNAKTAPLAESGTPGKIAAKTIEAALNPKNFAANAGYQAYNAGQEDAAGKHVNPVSQAESLGVYQLGFPLLGAAGHEAFDAVAPGVVDAAKGVINKGGKAAATVVNNASNAVPTILKAGKHVVSKFGEPAIAGAEKAAGISRENIVNDNEAGTLRDFADYRTGDYKPDANTTNQLIRQARNAAGTAGIDVTSGSPADITDRIYNYLGKRRDFVNAHNSIAEGGYVRVPTGAKDVAPDLSDQQKEYVNDYANMLQNMAGSDEDNVLTRVRKAGGISKSDYEDLPTTLKNKNGMAMDDLATELGYPDDNALHSAISDALDRGDQPKTQRDWFDQARQELESGKASFGASDDYKQLPTKQVSEASSKAAEVDDATPAPAPQAPVAPIAEPDLEPLPKLEPEPSGELGGQKITASDMGPQTGDELDAKSYAEAFGLTQMQAEKDLSDMRAQALDHKSMTKEELAKLGPQEKLNVKQRRELINSDEKQKTANDVSISPITEGKLKDRARSAIAQTEGINQEADHRLTRAVQLGNRLSTADQALLYKYDDGASISSLVSEAKNPKLFKRAATAYADATDYDLAARRAAGEATLKQNNYVPHQYAVDEKWLDEHGVPENQRIYQGKDVKGFRDTSAKYKSYAAASKETDGLLKPLNSNPIQDLEDYRAGGFVSRRNNLLTAALAKAAPDDIGSLQTLAVGDKHLTQGAGNLPFSVSDDLQHRLKGYQRSTPPANIFTKTIDKTGKVINSATKKVLFFGTPFHYMNEQASFIGKNLLNPKNLAVGEKRFVQAIATKGGYQRLLDRATELKLANGDSLLEAVRKMGVVLPDDSRLNRASSAFSLTEAENALRKGLDPNSKQAVDLGQQINHLMGHRNLAIESESPRTHNLLSVGTLAPSWSTTQLGLVKDALTKRGIGGNTAGGYARRAVIGKRALLAGAGIGGSVAVTGNLPTGSEALNEAGLTLKNPVPNIELNSKTKSGESQEMVAPTDPLGLAVGLVTNPSHFVQSRLSPALSFATKVATNQNWNGEPLAEGPHDSNYYKQLVENAALNSGVPIGVQNLTNPTHNVNNPSIIQGIEQDFGGRLKTNPNDPKYVASQQYYSALSHATDRLTPGSPAMGAFLENFGVTKDPVTGKYLMTPNSEMTVAKSASLNAYPAAQAAANAMAKELQAKGQKVDPYYLLTPAQQKAYNAYETMAPLSADRTDWQNRNTWYPDFANKQSAFFDSLPPGDPTKPTNPIKYPTFDAQTNSDLDTYYALTDSTAKNNFLDQHPNVGQAMNAQFAYSNATRVARGYQPLKGYPQPTPELQAALDHYSTLDKASAKAYAAGHPQIYNFFQLASQYSLNKAAGLNQIQGNDLTPAEVKTINGLGEDIYYNGGLIGQNGQLVAPTGGSGTGAGGGYGSHNNALANALYYLESQKTPKVVTLHPVGSSGIVRPVTASYRLPQSGTPYVVKKSTISSGKKVKV